MDRREFELELRLKIEILSDEIIRFELNKRRTVFTGNRRTDICLLAHVLSFERPDLFNNLVEFYFNGDDE